ncbi:MAG: tetratricopeptide repeat protein [Armatimonadota bacterium]
MNMGLPALLFIQGLSESDEFATTPVGPELSLPHVLGLGLGVTVSALLLTWMMRAWSERTISGGTAVIAFAVHVLILVTLYLTSPVLLLVYEGIVLLAIACSPLISLIADRRLLRQLRQEEVARCRNTLTHDPGNTAAHAMLGKAYLDLGNYDEAVKELEVAIAADPDHAQTELFHLQEARARMGR